MLSIVRISQSRTPMAVTASYPRFSYGRVLDSTMHLNMGHTIALMQTTDQIASCNWRAVAYREVAIYTPFYNNFIVIGYSSAVARCS